MRFNLRWTAFCMATCRMIRQESAEAIVVRPWRTKGRTLGRKKARASSVTTMNPIGGVEDRRGVGNPDSDENLLEQILSRPNMSMAWKRVKANKGAPGIDKMTVNDFLSFAREHWEKIRSSIYAGTYQPSESALPAGQAG